MATKLKKDFIQDSITNNSKNPKELWKTIKKIIPSKCSSGPTKLTDDQDNEITNDDKMANMFNDYFVSIGESLASRIPSSIFANPFKLG